MFTQVRFLSFFNRVFFTLDNQISFIKTPFKNQNSKLIFPFIYEFVSIKINKSHKNNIFESLFKVKKSDSVKIHKKHYPRILSFYSLLENNAEVYLIVFNKSQLI